MGMAAPHRQYLLVSSLKRKALKISLRRVVMQMA
jgi:hypothetical protein